MLVKAKKRRSIRECARLVLELRDQPSVCAAIDAAIAHATARDPEDRPASAMGFATTITAALRTGYGRGPVSVSRWSSRSRNEEQHTGLGRWSFHVRHAPGDGRAIWSVAWDAAGCCMAATTAGLEFWDGMRWAKVPAAAERGQIRLAHHVGAGEWLLGGQNSDLTLYQDGTLTSVPGHNSSSAFGMVARTGTVPVGASTLFSIMVTSPLARRDSPGIIATMVAVLSVSAWRRSGSSLCDTEKVT